MTRCTDCGRLERTTLISLVDRLCDGCLADRDEHEVSFLRAWLRAVFGGER